MTAPKVRVPDDASKPESKIAPTGARPLAGGRREDADFARCCAADALGVGVHSLLDLAALDPKICVEASTPRAAGEQR